MTRYLSYLENPFTFGIAHNYVCIVEDINNNISIVKLSIKVDKT